MRIEIVGGMGVGKTTLCKNLEDLGLRCIYESLTENPYLSLSYENPDEFGFYSQMSFVLGNFYTAKKFDLPNEITFFDFSTINDKAYASIFLNGKAQELALETIDFLEQKEGRCDLLLYLSCSPEVQLERIRGRNRPHERNVGIEFVRELDTNLRYFVQQAEDSGARVLTLDTEAMDLRQDIAFIKNFVDKLQITLKPPYKSPANGFNKNTM
jgi:deoxyguanosine kinase